MLETTIYWIVARGMVSPSNPANKIEAVTSCNVTLNPKP